MSARSPVPASPHRLLKTEDGEERFIDPPKLLAGYVIGELAEPGGIDSTDLLGKDPRLLVVDQDLRAKRGRSSTLRRGCYQDDRPRQHLVRLDDHTESPSSLLMAAALRQPKLVNVTAAHAGSPSARRPRASRADPPRRTRARVPHREGLPGHGVGRRSPPARRGSPPSE